ncbi:MAG TPA: geranylgeranylglyceryl/heptaprenylglyceryl phosphate synthase [Thermoplasmatales archaeon]|nr:geranylgeranylglyceryl/heptaprenylglyceryl phosphate synthase [Thermoplasmatales archaeon]
MIELMGKRKLHFSLIDPDKQSPAIAGDLARRCEEYGSDAIMVGGSTVPDRETTYRTIEEIKKNSSLPVIIFPNSANTIAENADYIFFMDLLNSPALEYKREQHMKGAKLVKKWGIKPIPMGYMVISTSSKPTTVETKIELDVIGSDDIEKAVDYAIYAECMGMRCVYLDAGSNPEKPVSDEMIKAVRKAVDIPIIVGGGIKSAEVANKKIEAGADVIVTGSIIEENVEELRKIVEAIHSASSS